MKGREVVRGLVLMLFVVTPLLISSTVAWAQTTGTIRGNVTDPTGALVPEVEIEPTHVSTNRKYAASTTKAGVYTLASLPIGDNRVRATQSVSKDSPVSKVM